MKKINVAVLFGGCSHEYKVSLESASSLLEHIDRNQYEVTPVGITRQGDWFFYAGDIAKIASDTWMENGCQPIVFSMDRSNPGFYLKHYSCQEKLDIDVVFPMLHGTYGEDGRVQGMLELAGIPYVGCGMLSSALCMDKAVSHQWAEANNIPAARFVEIHSEETYLDKLKDMEDLNYPLFVKPANGGSSIGIAKVFNQKELVDAIRHAFCFDEKVVVEETIEGDEIGCAVLKTQHKTFIGEADHLHVEGDFFDYEGKYVTSAADVTFLKDEDPTTNQKAKETALELYRIHQCHSLARVDMFLTPDGKIVFNEINTLPGFTANSRFPRMMKAAGYQYGQIIDICIKDALGL